MEKENFIAGKKKDMVRVNLFEAIKKSCDCYFYNLAKSIEVDDLSKFFEYFFTRKSTGIDIPNELMD